MEHKNMTEIEALEKLRAYHKCKILQVKVFMKIVTINYVIIVIYVMHKVMLENILKV